VSGLAPGPPQAERACDLTRLTVRAII